MYLAEQAYALAFEEGKGKTDIAHYKKSLQYYKQALERYENNINKETHAKLKVHMGITIYKMLEVQKRNNVFEINTAEFQLGLQVLAEGIQMAAEHSIISLEAKAWLYFGTMLFIAPNAHADHIKQVLMMR